MNVRGSTCPCWKNRFSALWDLFTQHPACSMLPGGGPGEIRGCAHHPVPREGGGGPQSTSGWGRQASAQDWSWMNCQMLLGLSTLPEFHNVLLVIFLSRENVEKHIGFGEFLGTFIFRGTLLILEIFPVYSRCHLLIYCICYRTYCVDQPRKYRRSSKKLRSQ